MTEGHPATRHVKHFRRIQVGMRAPLTDLGLIEYILDKTANCKISFFSLLPPQKSVMVNVRCPDLFPTSSACWVLFSYRRAQSVCSKENRREAQTSSNLQQKPCSERTRYNFSVLVQNRYFQRFSPVNSLVLIMFLSHPETTKFIGKTNFWYESGRISSPRRLSTIFLISASRLFFLKGSQLCQIMEFIVF